MYEHSLSSQSFNRHFLLYQFSRTHCVSHTLSDTQGACGVYRLFTCTAIVMLMRPIRLTVVCHVRDAFQVPVLAPRSGAVKALLRMIQLDVSDTLTEAHLASIKRCIIYVRENFTCDGMNLQSALPKDTCFPWSCLSMCQAKFPWSRLSMCQACQAWMCTPCWSRRVCSGSSATGDLTSSSSVSAERR